jgi:tetratricopeptide (TPR) repeat protein
MRKMIGLRNIGWLALLTMALFLVVGLSRWLNPLQANLEIEAANRAAQAGELHSASLHLAKAAEQLPGRNDLWELAGRDALQAGDLTAAIHYLENGASLGGLSAKGWEDLGDAYRQAGDLKAAERAFRAAVVQVERPVDLYQKLLQVHRLLGDYSAAIADLEALKDLMPGDARLYYQSGLLNAVLQPEKALLPLEQAAQLDAKLAGQANMLHDSILSAQPAGDPAYTLLAAGRALASLGEWDLAREAFRQATLIRPDYAEAWAYHGEASQHFGQNVAGSTTQPTPVVVQSPQLTPTVMAGSEDGLEDLEKALALDPNSLSANTFLGLYWQRQGRFDLALICLKKAASLEPQNAVLQMQLGEILAIQGDLTGGLNAYQRAVSLAPDSAAYLRFLADYSLRYEYDPAQIALPAARRAILIAPNDSANLDTMGQVLIKLGDLVNAERFLNRALSVDPDFALAHLHMGSLYLLRGESERARQEFSLASSLAPGSAIADQSDRLLQTLFP